MERQSAKMAQNCCYEYEVLSARTRKTVYWNRLNKNVCIIILFFK